ncbi:hypothetical protein ACIQFP_06915 [Nocardiopsis alba]|uniref:hypothetical protein n=1 Tax=Nocardiopsis alba TaxID=53437 RepID=UPI0034039CE1
MIPGIDLLSFSYAVSGTLDIVAHVETIMTSADRGEAAEALSRLQGVTLFGEKRVEVVFRFRGGLIVVEEVEDDEGTFAGLTTAIDVYGSTDADAKERAEGLFSALGGLKKFKLGMYPDDDDNYGWYSAPEDGKII